MAGWSSFKDFEVISIQGKVYAPVCVGSSVTTLLIVVLKGSYLVSNFFYLCFDELEYLQAKLNLLMSKLVIIRKLASDKGYFS